MTTDNQQKSEHLCQKGIVQAKQGDFMNSVMSFVNAIQLCPNLVDGYANLGTLLYSNGKQLSLKLLEFAFSCQPDSEWIAENLADAQQAEKTILGQFKPIVRIL